MNDSRICSNASFGVRVDQMFDKYKSLDKKLTTSQRSYLQIYFFSSSDSSEKVFIFFWLSQPFEFIWSLCRLLILFFNKSRITSQFCWLPKIIYWKTNVLPFLQVIDSFTYFSKLLIFNFLIQNIYTFSGCCHTI